MSFNKFYFSLTTIPSRINQIESTLETLVIQSIKPEKIILNIPKQYNLRFTESIDENIINKLKEKFKDFLLINILEEDYGPGTKLLGLIYNNIIDLTDKNTYIILVDDDILYNINLIKDFNYHNDLNKTAGLSFGINFKDFTYFNIGEGVMGFFIKSNILNEFKDYYEIIKSYKSIKYHDDFYISYYFYIKNLPLKKVLPQFLIFPKLLSNNYYQHIYNKTKKTHFNTDALWSIKSSEFNRITLNKTSFEILEKLKEEKKFDHMVKYEKIQIKKSKENSKIIKLEKSYDKNTKLIFLNKYLFDYTFNNNELTIKRTDCKSGWKEELIAYVIPNDF